MSMPPYTVGTIIAIIVLLLAIVFWAIGTLAVIPAFLIAALAVARLT